MALPPFFVISSIIISETCKIIPHDEQEGIITRVERSAVLVLFLMVNTRRAIKTTMPLFSKRYVIRFSVNESRQHNSNMYKIIKAA